MSDYLYYYDLMLLTVNKYLFVLVQILNIRSYSSASSLQCFVRVHLSLGVDYYVLEDKHDKVNLNMQEKNTKRQCSGSSGKFRSGAWLASHGPAIADSTRVT